MRKIFLLIIFVVIIPGSLSAREDYELDTREALSGYNPIYMLAGFTEQDQVKIQISFKYNVSYPFTWGLYLAYTQIMFWQLYEVSGPFEELNYSPEIFWRFESGNNFVDNIDIPVLDYFQLGWKHLSNGKDELSSRGYDNLYAQLQLSLGSYLNGGINLQYFYCFPDTENSDIQDYIGSMEIKLFGIYRDHYRHIDYEEIYFKFGFGGGANGFDFLGGWQEVGIKVRRLFSWIRPYVQIYHGYAESLIDYDTERPADLENLYGFAVRVGIIME